MNPGRGVRLVRTIVRTYGVAGLLRRGVHEARRSFGAFHAGPRRAPILRQDDRGSALYQLRGDWSAVPETTRASILERGRRVVAGEYEAFGHDWRRFPETAAEWHTHPRTGFVFGDAAWWTIPHLPRGSDIKDVWEPARFSWVYDLLRAYSLTHHEAFATAFRHRFSSWIDANPPFHGVHWSCGQETAIRAIALLHAEAAFQSDEDSRRVRTVLAASAERIADAIGYALSQRNNHGISEAAGLIHLGHRLRNEHPDAAAWSRAGLRYLDAQIADQFATDGWYAQHSFTYTRVALEQALHAQRVLERDNRSLSDRSLARIDAAVSLLQLLVDEQTGHVPNHGANDGGRAVLLSTAAYRDFRPLITLAAVVRRTPVPADIPVDAETTNWLGAQPVAPSARRSDGVMTGPSGWAIARVGDTQAFLRAGTYVHRPSHLDALHLDVRFGSHEAVVDPGTFSYNAPPPWNNGLASATVHNGPVVDDKEPAERGPRFLWYSWPEARINSARYRDGVAELAADIPNRVVRSVRVTADRVEVTDRVVDPNAHSVQVAWLVAPDTDASLQVDADDARGVTPRESATDAWFSPSYELRVPTRAIKVRREGEATKRQIRTVIARPRSHT